VLSFPQHSVAELKKIPRGQPWELGDIVISLEKVREQALDKGHSFRKELEILLVHGLVHLLGYDHEISEKEAQRMERLERKIFPR
jgi:probable rRNA maturation factor